MRSPHVAVTIDLRKIRSNARAIFAHTPNTPGQNAGGASDSSAAPDPPARRTTSIWATIKADAYGLGAARVATALADLVDGFCVFALEEAVAIDLWATTRKPAIALGPPTTLDPGAWLAAHVRPTVTTVDQARRLAPARPILCVDTGMQRFACPPADVPAVLGAGGVDEAFTHATKVEHARRLREITAGHDLTLHAAASSLLDEPDARLDLVRPGFALYRGAATVTTRLADVRRSAGPIGYTGWTSETGHHGAILAGYSHGLRPGPALVNGRRQRIAEIGMQSAYVTLHADDRAGDEVVLLADDLPEPEVAFAWGVTPHHALLVLTNMGTREYRE
jgi:alanine racemase